MRVPYSILNQYVEVFDIDPHSLVEKLNTHSVEATLDFFGNSEIEKAVVGKIVKTQPHPSLKKLLVCEVDIGDQKVVICTNDKTVKEGDKVFLVLAGGRIGNFPIGERDFKGVRSQGMFLGLKELVGVESEGVFKFHDESVKEGTDVKKLLGLGEPIIELDITPNRGDLLSVKGLAREISALYGRPIKKQTLQPKEVFGNEIEVEILEPKACNRYRAAVIRNVQVKESPLWLMVALWKFGEAVINNVVDITNYLLFTEGNPMHAFDLDKIEGKVVVRRAKEGEKFVALNKKEYELSSNDLVIADDKEVLALAGIIGGLSSAVDENTKNILLETAHFDPFTVRKTAKRLDIRTESSYRFERNVDIENIPNAQSKAIDLILQLAGGQLTTIKEEYPNPYQPQKVKLSLSKYRKYTGSDISPLRAKEILDRLGLETTITFEGLDEETLKRVILKKLAQERGCDGFRLPTLKEKEQGFDGFLLCKEEEIPVIIGEKNISLPENGLKVNYRLTQEGLEIKVL
ncbi:MAG: phenylalanine--tRNA ligase subunit beta [Aquificota bacterium]